jgi:multicomponent Na+:H+ antiporter subunit G
MLIFIGLFFFIIGAFGINRFHNTYSRLHASSKVGTVGLVGILTGAAILMPGATLKILLLGIFMLAAGPVTAHAIAVSVYRSRARDENQQLSEEDRFQTITHPAINVKELFEEYGIVRTDKNEED